MEKWADYLISEVQYGTNHQIQQVKLHTEVDDGISEGQHVDRSQIAHNIKKGKTYKTIFRSLKGWKIGDDIRLNRVNGDHFIRIDKNKVEQDFLGPILQF